MSVVLRQIAPSRNAEIKFGRFLRHTRVNVSSIKSAFMNRNGHLDKVCAQRHILLVEDTSELSFGLEPNKTGLSKVGNGKEAGFYVHPVIALDALDGGCLGIGETEIYKRTTYEEGSPMNDLKYRSKELQKKPFCDKESYRWYSAIKTTLQWTPSANGHTVVADRESDIYEAMCGFNDLNCDFALRSQYLDRTLNSDRSGHSLQKELSLWSSQGRYSFDLPATDKRSAHTAVLDIKFGLVLLSRPHAGITKHLPKTMEVSVVEVKECSESVINNEQPVHWVILTSHSIESVEQALNIIRFYRWRWVIEQVFRTIKSQGLNMEQSELTTYEGLAKLALMTLIAAVQIMQLVQARDGNTSQTIECVFSQPEIKLLNEINPTLEGKTDKLKNPFHYSSLAFAAWIIARLAGWSGYKSQRPPGPITMKLGFERFKLIKKGYYLRI